MPILPIIALGALGAALLSEKHGWRSHSDGRLLGFKVMRYDATTMQIVSGANSRVRLDMEPGTRHTMPPPGIFLAKDRDYVLENYACHDVNAVLTYAFRLKDVTTGSMTDREPEITVSSAELVEVALLNDDLEPWVGSDTILDIGQAWLKAQGHLVGDYHEDAPFAAGPSSSRVAHRWVQSSARVAGSLTLPASVLLPGASWRSHTKECTRRTFTISPGCPELPLHTAFTVLGSCNGGSDDHLSSPVRGSWVLGLFDVSLA